MHIIDVILLVIKGEKDDELQGRTLLQKKIYFLSVMMEHDLGFTAHYYGPYSSYVAGHLDSLVSYGILKETLVPLSSNPPEQSPFGEIRKHAYIYSLIPNAFEKVWKVAEKKPSFDKWKQKLKAINDQSIARDSNSLSIAAKIHYIVDWEGEKNAEEVLQTAKEYGWDFTLKDIKNVLSFLTELGLVSVD
ncbi:hypothetical protein J4G08_18440 [Candidatus Poribacteria bacterium]|nr:hypothetical protein [Candidatus Poribacteria bacterium]